MEAPRLNRLLTNKKPYRVITGRGLFTLYRCKGGLAFYVASAFTLDELAKYVPPSPKARGAGVPLKTLTAI
jgi:hypothetical protein